MDCDPMYSKMHDYRSHQRDQAVPEKAYLTVRYPFLLYRHNFWKNPKVQSNYMPCVIGIMEVSL
jgi:hypothetical protein